MSEFNQIAELEREILEYLNGNPRVSSDELNYYFIFKKHNKVTTTKILQIIKILEQKELLRYVRFNNKTL